MGTESSTLPDRDGALYASVVETLVSTIVNVVGEEFYEEAEIGLDSKFAEDIELESMEMMEIADQLIETYGERVDFIGWFSEMELEELVAMTIGTVVDFIVTSLES